MTLKFLALAAGLCLPAGAAYATESIVCRAPDDAAVISVLAGHLPVLSVLRASVRVGKKTWSTDPVIEPGTPMLVGQAWSDGEKMMVDLLDDNFNEMVAQLRVFHIEGDEGVVEGGVLKVGESAWTVTCEGQ